MNVKKVILFDTGSEHGWVVEDVSRVMRSHRFRDNIFNLADIGRGHPVMIDGELQTHSWTEQVHESDAEVLIRIDQDDSGADGESRRPVYTTYMALSPLENRRENIAIEN